MRPPRRALLLAALLAPATLAAQDAVQLRLRPPAGVTLRYQTVVALWISGPGLPDDTIPGMRIVSRSSVVLLASRRDTFDMQISRDAVEMASAMLNAMGQRPPASPTVDTIQLSALGATIRSAARWRADSARAASAGLPEFLAAPGEGEAMFVVFPERPLVIGATWGDTTLARSDSVEGGPMSTRVRINNRLERLTTVQGRTVAVIIRTSSIEMTMDAGGAWINGVGTIEVDLDTGLVLRSSDTSEGSLDVAGMSMPIRSRMVTERLP